MATICYTRNGVKKSLLSLTEKITTPSIKMVGPGGTFYTPLFTGNTGNTRDIGKWRYKLSGFTVGSYHAAESRAWINSKPVVTEYYYAYNLRWIYPGIAFFVGIRAADPDGDSLTYTWTSTDDRPAWATHEEWELVYHKNYTDGIETDIQPDILRVKCNRSPRYITFYANISDGHESINASISVNISSDMWLDMIDHNTRYTGTPRVQTIGQHTSYSYVEITGFHDEGGIPFIQFIGFPSEYEGTQVYYTFCKRHVHNHITSKFPDLHPDDGWKVHDDIYFYGNATVTLDIWNDTRNVLLDGSRNVLNGHGAIRVGTGYLPYGDYTFICVVESRTDPGKNMVYCCHIHNRLTGHGTVD